ncbi:hypothetical protein AVEN_16451-1 [Araneus ventricosus]|uniref:DUF4806 domain-containing protein n=1 Tax=Araneus ventricosus TaxID=182803 RepID=A0A4Y2ITU9_ARAVE|nr:hypothetical protein AVEN_16451-1 [Araneus ventricosus]
MEFNKKLSQDSHLQHLLIKALVSVGDKDMRCNIHNMLRRVLSDEVAELYYSLSGKRLKDVIKKPILVTEFSKSIFIACQRVFKDIATEVKVREAVADWLNQAKVRKIRRMQRHEKMHEKNMEKNAELI